MMEILIAVFIGVLAGTFTGLTPGIHINLVSVLLLSSSPFLLPYTSLLALACFIIAMSVTHSFLDSIPSIFLGAPDSATALGVLPGHRYLLKGWGYMAAKLTVIGSLVAALLSVFLFPLFLVIIKYSYPFVQPYIGYLLLSVTIFMILRDKRKEWALLVFLVAGILGLIVLNISGLRNPLFPLLSGLFGVSTLLVSLNDNTTLPPQKEIQEIKVKKTVAFQALASGQFSGFLTAMLPGLGSATAAVLSLQITRDLGDHGYMILQGSINTVNFILSLATLLVLNKARNGSVIAVQFLLDIIDLPQILLFLSVTLLVSGVASLLTLFFARQFSRLISKVNYQVLVISIIGFIVLLTPLLSSWQGVLILLTSTALGLIPATVKVARIHGMGCLLLPVILYFIL